MLSNYLKCMKIQLTYIWFKSKYYYLVNTFRICSGGELFDRIVEEGHFNEKKAAIVFK